MPYAHWKGHLGEEKVVVGGGAQKIHSGRPEHAEWFVEDAGLLDLVMSAPQSIFGVGKLVYKPGAVSNFPWRI
jgi:hypothetical protein